MVFATLKPAVLQFKSKPLYNYETSHSAHSIFSTSHDTTWRYRTFKSQSRAIFLIVQSTFLHFNVGVSEQ